jgi:hypothetical protein
LRKGHDRLEGEWGSVGIVAVGNAANRVPKNLDRRFRQVLIVVSGAGLAEVFEWSSPPETEPC